MLSIENGQHTIPCQNLFFNEGACVGICSMYVEMLRQVPHP